MESFAHYNVFSHSHLPLDVLGSEVGGYGVQWTNKTRIIIYNSHSTLGFPCFWLLNSATPLCWL